MRADLLQMLSLTQIEVAADFYFHGMTQDEIAAKRGVTRQSIAKLLSKVRARLLKIGLPEPQRYHAHEGRERNIPPRLLETL
jgi:DNA-binding transcriptional regulator LsrR (DeoR family)